MMLHIERKGTVIAVVKDFQDIMDRGEIAQFIAELAQLQHKLIYIFDHYEEKR